MLLQRGERVRHGSNGSREKLRSSIHPSLNYFPPFVQSTALLVFFTYSMIWWLRTVKLMKTYDHSASTFFLFCFNHLKHYLFFPPMKTIKFHQLLRDAVLNPLPCREI